MFWRRRYRDEGARHHERLAHQLGRTEGQAPRMRHVLGVLGINRMPLRSTGIPSSVLSSMMAYICLAARDSCGRVVRFRFAAQRPRSREGKVAHSAAPRGHLGCFHLACDDHLTRGSHLTWGSASEYLENIDSQESNFVTMKQRKTSILCIVLSQLQPSSRVDHLGSTV